MLEFKQRQKIRKRIYSKWTIGFLVIVFLFLAHGTWGIYQKMQSSKIKLDAAEESYEALKARHAAIGSQIGHLGTETGLEEEIRTKYNLAKEGENVIVLIDKEDEDTNAAATVQSGFWSKISSWFR